MWFVVCVLLIVVVVIFLIVFVGVEDWLEWIMECMEVL